MCTQMQGQLGAARSVPFASAPRTICLPLGLREVYTPDSSSGGLWSRAVHRPAFRLPERSSGAREHAPGT